MSPERRISRRAFLASLAVVGAGGGLVLLLRRSRPGDPVAEEAKVALAGIPADPKAARTIGSAYLAAEPGEADEAALVAGLFGEDGLGEAAPGDLSERLRSLVRTDFAAGRTVVLGGWVLARSEARMCALVEILAQTGRLVAADDSGGS